MENGFQMEPTDEEEEKEEETTDAFVSDDKE